MESPREVASKETRLFCICEKENCLCNILAINYYVLFC